MSNCSCCCTNTLNFCEQDICGELNLDIKSQVAGMHKLITHFLGKKVTLSKEFDVDEEISFSLDGLNENYEYTAELYDPDGTKILIKKDNVDYDCFKFKTVINVAV
jgi:hypothetical protein